MTNPSDETLMVAYQNGDLAAFEAIYARHSGRVLGWFRNRTRDPESAEELFQATFMKLHQSRSTYQPSYPVLPWLFSICRSVWIDALRGGKLSPKEDLPGTLPDMAAPEPEARPEISDLPLGELRPEQRRIVELRYENDLSFEEIALRLGITPENARQKLSRAIRRLKEVMK